MTVLSYVVILALIAGGALIAVKWTVEACSVGDFGILPAPVSLLGLFVMMAWVLL